MKKIMILFMAAGLLFATTALNANALEESIALTYPHGGEELIAGTSCIITWTSQGDVANVNLEYFSDSGTTFHTITDSAENDGAYTWYVCRDEISE